MRFYADLHIHSKYSRACSKDCDLEHLSWWARRKGVTVVGTGDFTHPAWYEHLRENLEPAEPGLFRLRPELDRDIKRTLPPGCHGEVRFMLSVEISTIYKRDDRTRKVHHLVYVPDLDAAAEFNRRLARIGNLGSDGRPILGLDSRDLLEITLECGDGAYLVPAHVWTPWFAALGSKSGFDTIDDCYADLAGHIFALETGLSSDPAMNWRVSHLDRYRLVSNSDAHSPPILGREATVFDTEVDYFAIRRALETGAGFAGTVEFFPEEGKYHLDGHRTCGVRLDPPETRARDGRCPVCAKPLTVGVLHRVEQLADRSEGVRPSGAADFASLIPLPEIMGELLRVGPKSKKVYGEITALTAEFGPELQILEQVPVEEVATRSPLLAEALARLRTGRVIRDPGYDGEYGVIRLFRPEELRSREYALFDVVVPTATAESAAEATGGPLAPAAASPTRPATSPPAATSSALPFVSALDPDQQAAVDHQDGPLLIIAGPGTGKTRTLTHRIATLVASGRASADRCLAITFTTRAAEEMRERLEALLPGDAERLTIVTFHALGLRILREQHERAGLPVDFEVTEDGEHASDPRIVGFDDLIRRPVELLSEDPELAATYRRRYEWISVDEYQDVDEWQYRLLRLLAPPDGNVCAIGDPDQAIYGFRGADVGFFLRFRTDFPAARVVQLTRNYRSGRHIVDGALQVVAPATLVPGRVLRPASADRTAPIGVHHAADERAEAAFVAQTIDDLLGGTSFHSLDTGRATGHRRSGLSFADIAVLYRTDAQAQPLMEGLTAAGVPFQKRSHDRLLDRPGVRMIADELAYLDVGGSTVHDRVVRAARALAERDPGRAADVHTAVDLLRPLAERCGDDVERFRQDLALDAEVDSWDPRADMVSLLTLHASKGLEFPVVFIVGCQEGLLPLPWTEDVAEERRLLFVGITRARLHLYLSFSGKPSPFLADLRPETYLRLGDGLPRQRERARQLRLL